MEHVEGDLARSKQLREKQAKEFQRQVEDERQRHEQKVKRNLRIIILSNKFRQSLRFVSETNRCYWSIYNFI